MGAKMAREMITVPTTTIATIEVVESGPPPGLRMEEVGLGVDSGALVMENTMDRGARVLQEHDAEPVRIEVEHPVELHVPVEESYVEHAAVGGI